LLVLAWPSAHGLNGPLCTSLCLGLAKTNVPPPSILSLHTHTPHTTHHTPHTTHHTPHTLLQEYKTKWHFHMGLIDLFSYVFHSRSRSTLAGKYKHHSHARK